MLEVGMSEHVDTDGVKDISPGRGTWTVHTEVDHPLGGAFVVRHDSDDESLHMWVAVCRDFRTAVR